MSYILDALKKSEQERGHGNIPDVQTVHSSSLNYRTEKKAYWPYILIAAVILNLLAIIYFIVDKQAVENTKATAPQTSIATQTEVAPEKTETITQAVIATRSESQNSAIEKPKAKTVKTEIQPAEKPEPVAIKTEEPAIKQQTKILEFYELPESIKQDLPSIIISAHVYSTNPMQRSIVINNNFLEEGEYVLDGLTLHEITPDGAIFDYKDIRFSYGVVSGWQ